MNKAFYEHTKIQTIKAGDIARHPRVQRVSPIKSFENKLGEFDAGKCVDLIHVVKNYKPGTPFLAVDGATRVEACVKNNDFGPNTKLLCKVYGNGVAPSDKELAELFLVLNTDRIRQSKMTEFEKSVMAERGSAVYAKRLAELLGKRFDAKAGLWNIVETYGEQVAENAVKFAIDTWGVKDRIPGPIIRALAIVFSDKESSKTLGRRRSALKKSTPENIQLRAKTRFLTQVGIRDSVTVWIVRILLGKRA